jgi:alkylation response protein AidB-like acyl-CoA dehydrogenase
MDFAFSEEQEELRRYARQWLADRAPMAAVRELMASSDGFDRGQWRELAEMGWLGMAIPEEYGGAGFGFLDVAVLLEEQGRSLFPSPFLPSVVMAATAIERAGSEEQKQQWLPGIASGEVVATVARTEVSGRWDEAGIRSVAEPVEGGWRLSGTKSHVLAGHTADLLIVPARSPAGVSLFLVDGTSPGVARSRLDTMDMTRAQAKVTLESVEVPRSALLGEDGTGWELLADLDLVAGVALALEQVGGASVCLETAVAYAKERRQFGRPIGSFQAVKHMCADMKVQVEAARSAACYAAWAVAVDSDEVPVVARLASAFSSEAFFRCAADNIQIHGGIGFTWEHDAHLYLKRAKSSELMFGSPADHRREVARTLLGDP